MSQDTTSSAIPSTNGAATSVIGTEGPSIAIVIYTLHGHVTTLAEAEKAGIEAAGGKVTIYQVAETLPAPVLAKMHALPKPEYPVIQPQDLLKHDGILVGVASRFASMPAQMKSFWDSTGQLAYSNALAGKLVGAFVSTGGQGGGQEATFFSLMSTFVHHGMIFVPLGYKDTVHHLSSLEEIHGGSPWGAGTFAGTGGGGPSRQATKIELEVAQLQGKLFYQYVARTNWSTLIAAKI
ncbi:hypothetical protein FRB96_000339 [Tulasnella sp. 330]|nr:hypothetical protein FRB96_000339 [Tulasnella sp. 330]KAG8885030.1 hypothetical protein FRB97_002537 [Tulasnella sp. 331]KAG8890895.1 hypothetical protein FRB98_002915 [Tulasnella sp. 332]